MKLIYALLSTICLSLPTLGQDDNSKDWIKVLSYGVGNHTQETEITLEQAEQRSSQCLPQQFSNANLTLSNSSNIKNVWVKFDYKEKILLVRQEDKVLVGAPNIVKLVMFHDSSINPLINVGQLGRSYGRTGFYSVLLNEEDNYLVKYLSFEQKDKIANATINKTEVFDATKEESDFIKNEEILISKNQKVYQLDNLKAKTLSQFDIKQDQLQAFIKENKLKYKNEDDLKKFALYYWSL